MNAAGRHPVTSRGRAISFAVILVAIGVAIYAARWSGKHPSTDDASLDADVVHVAAAVSGRILEIPVKENTRVSKGDLLFQIDSAPHRFAVEQATADLRMAEAELETKKRFLATQRSNATIAADHAKNAEENYQLAMRTTKRLRPLSESGYVPKQQLDQAEVAEHDAATLVRSSREGQIAAEAAIDTEEAAEAAVRARQAALAIAQRALDDTMVRAPHDGYVVGLKISSGEWVAPGQALFTLINTEEWFAVGNFRETDLAAIAIGDCATAFSMIDRRQPIKGVVEGIGWGVHDQDRIDLPRSVPIVERSLNWVRVAQRFPVRVKLERPPESLMRLGASAVVEIKHGSGCR